MNIGDLIKKQTEAFISYLKKKRYNFLIQYGHIKSLIRYGYWDFFNAFNIEINTSCNRRCSYCPNSLFERGIIKNEKLMDINLYYKLINELAEIDFNGRISPHFYGEPLIDKRLTVLMKYTKEKLPKSKLVIISNGDALSIERFNELLDAGVDKFIITQHGESMSENMKKIFDYLKKYSNKRRRIEYNCISSYSLFNRGGMVKLKAVSTIPRCAFPGNPVTIDHDGNVILCCNDYFSTVKFGNIKDQKILDIWFSEKYKNIRKQLRKEQYKLPICLKCIGMVEPNVT